MLLFDALAFFVWDGGVDGGRPGRGWLAMAAMEGEIHPLLLVGKGLKSCFNI